MGASNVVDGSIFIMMMVRHVNFTVTSDFISIRFRLALTGLRSLCWASTVCGSLLNSQPGAASPSDIPGAEKIGVRERPGWLEVYT